MRRAPLIVLAFALLVAAGCTSPRASILGAPSGTPASAAGSPSAAAPLGTWSMTMTAADMEAAGYTDAGLIGENTGTFTLTVADDGTWSIAQATSVPIRWPVFRGTYAATGPGEIEMLTEFPTDYAGDLVTVAWSLDAGNLRLRLVSPQDPLLKVNLETHPWAPLP